MIKRTSWLLCDTTVNPLFLRLITDQLTPKFSLSPHTFHTASALRGYQFKKFPKITINTIVGNFRNQQGQKKGPRLGAASALSGFLILGIFHRHRLLDYHNIRHNVS